MDAKDGRLRLADAAGTVWNGRGVLTDSAGTWRIPLGWTISKADMLRGTRAVSVQPVDGASSPSGTVEVVDDGVRVRSLRVEIPAQAQGPVKLLVSDATTLASLEQRELQPGKPTSWPELLKQLNEIRRNNTIYVRLISASTGTVVGGDTLPALPASVQSIFGSDATVARAPVARTVIGKWESRGDVAIVGSRELTLTLRELAW